MTLYYVLLHPMLHLRLVEGHCPSGDQICFDAETIHKPDIFAEINRCSIPEFAGALSS